MGLTMAELQDEAMARGIERQFLPSNKKDLLEFLVDGSIYLRKTKTWMDVERLKGKMAADCRRIEERKYSKDEAINESREEVSTTREVAKASIRDERASMREIKTAIREVRQHHYRNNTNITEEGLPVDITGRVVPPPPDADERKSTATSIATSVYDNKTPPCDNTASMSRSTTADDDTGVEDVFPPVVNERRADDKSIQRSQFQTRKPKHLFPQYSTRRYCHGQLHEAFSALHQQCLQNWRSFNIKREGRGHLSA
ncbi:expressed unknown protein [Seminavis robusta]|uniref:Uncharacterized protein n=1 Tax=Seminavis robusta TaxID=568900 RepID=A0A9N8DY81_9STRA|nr:expressed unknown protein [Seminavis robusta]|eukprot:Sro462_g147930.1 n/a (256) ;mRNA; r:22001-22851